jgi:hypothetical protein
LDRPRHCICRRGRLEAVPKCELIVNSHFRSPLLDDTHRLETHRFLTSTSTAFRYDRYDFLFLLSISTLVQTGFVCDPSSLNSGHYPFRSLAPATSNATSHFNTLISFVHALAISPYSAHWSTLKLTDSKRMALSEITRKICLAARGNCSGGCCWFCSFRIHDFSLTLFPS